MVITLPADYSSFIIFISGCKNTLEQCKDKLLCYPDGGVKITIEMCKACKETNKLMTDLLALQKKDDMSNQADYSVHGHLPSVSLFKIKYLFKLIFRRLSLALAILWHGNPF
jgi:hypothetical protein